MLFEFHTVRKTAKEYALLDSGATENSIDKDIWKGLGIGQFKLAKSLTVHNIDRTKNHQEKIKHFC